jgi:D-serine deaminase-like pyridoxal phosphate-dependent protein
MTTVSVARVGQWIDEVPTPAVLVDLDRLDSNLSRLPEIVAAHGAAFRPHVKAHKVPALATEQMRRGAVGIACAKVAEAEVFAAAGVRDIAIAYPVVGADKARRVARLARTMRIAVNVESTVGVECLSRAAGQARATIDAIVDVDSGMHRCGLDPADLDAFERIAGLIEKSDGLRLQGITTYRGKAFDTGAPLTNDEAGAAEGALMSTLAMRLRERGVEAGTVSAGSTATAAAVAAVTGVDEVRAGAYLFYDGAQVAVGSASIDDVALTVLATVVARPRSDLATVDAGTKTLSAGAPLRRLGFGQSLDGAVTLERLNEEHGVGRLHTSEVAIGDRMRFVPVHASGVVGASDELVGVRGDRVEEVWPVAARGARW